MRYVYVIILVLVLIVVKQREGYYNGNRASCTWRRITRYLEPSSSHSTSLDPISIINPNKNKKGIVSFTLFGNGKSERFWTELVEPLLVNAQKINDVLPGWGLRVYISSSLPKRVHEELAKSGYELMVMEEDPKQPYKGLLWRFLVAGEKLPFIICDADMLLDTTQLNLNGLQDVPKWLESDKTFFRRKLFPMNLLWPISAGSWGGKTRANGDAAIPDIKDRIGKYNYDWFGSDESFLSKEAWPLFEKEGYYNSYSKIEIASVILAVIILVIFLIVYFYSPNSQPFGRR